jgi:ketosteroid isomerase-like protein
MSEQNVETAERLIEGWNQADWGLIESLFWPDAETQAPEGWPEAEDPKGWPAIRRQFERLKESWSEDRFELETTEAVGDDVVLQHGHWRTRGTKSGIDVDFEVWIISRFRDGKIERAEFYLDEEQAMRAAGR